MSATVRVFYYVLRGPSVLVAAVVVAAWCLSPGDLVVGFLGLFFALGIFAPLTWPLLRPTVQDVMHWGLGPLADEPEG